ncbi:hypothetical protein [Jiella flava]|uniref:Uncharacterized protein n=1 Tax=Jiella flava TaxID=2816857 RepID=A0A939JVV5_9HYPH|nr:hypothetical protein [Jiella flava]MBO0664610.1 hypothetical protein [Jiella flava]
MPWKEADREKYAVIRERYATDLSDGEFERLRHLLPEPKTRGRKPTDPQCFALSHPIGMPMALAAEGFSAFHHRPEPFLSVARQ